MVGGAPLKVAMVVTPLDIPGGGARQALKLARELKAMGHEPTIVTPALDRAKCYPELLEGLDIRVAPPRAALKAVARVGRALNLDTLRRAPILAASGAIADGAEVINAHDQTANWPAARAAARLKVPTVWMCNEPPFWLHQVQMRRPFQRRLAGTPLRTLDPEWSWLKLIDAPAARAMDRIVVLDNKNVERVERVYGKDALVVRSGVDADFFAKGHGFGVLHDLPGDTRFVALHVGYAAPWKGQSEALQAFKVAAQHVQGAHLLLVGQAVKRTYAPLVESLGLAGKVTMWEGLSDANLADVYDACNVLLFPADQTWGLNVTEAMAAGKPTVVSRAAGVSEVIEDGRTGFVVPHGDIEAMATRVIDLANDEALAKRIGEAGRAFVRENLTWRAYAEGMMLAFRSALDERATS